MIDDRVNDHGRDEPSGGANVARDVLTTPRLSREAVQAVVSRQFPELAPVDARYLGAGWDTSVWVVNEAWAFRFPLRAETVPLLEAELRVLPHLAGVLPIPVTTPAFIGSPDVSTFPFPFYGARLIPGLDLVAAGLADDDRVAVAAAVGGCLRVLHEPALARALGPGLPHRTEWTDVSRTWARDVEQFETLERLGLWTRNAALASVLDGAGQLPRTGPSRLVHGDLHVGHVLVDASGAATGVIDWGDVSLAHPSLDLQIGWSGFAGPSRRAFLDSYGDTPEEWRLRARAAAVFYSASLALLAHRDRDPALLREALQGLDRATDLDA